MQLMAKDLGDNGWPLTAKAFTSFETANVGWSFDSPDLGVSSWSWMCLSRQLGSRIKALNRYNLGRRPVLWPSDVTSERCLLAYMNWLGGCCLAFCPGHGMKPWLYSFMRIEVKGWVVPHCLRRGLIDKVCSLGRFSNRGSGLYLGLGCKSSFVCSSSDVFCTGPWAPEILAQLLPQDSFVNTSVNGAFLESYVLEKGGKYGWLCVCGYYENNLSLWPKHRFGVTFLIKAPRNLTLRIAFAVLRVIPSSDFVEIYSSI